MDRRQEPIRLSTLGLLILSTIVFTSALVSSGLLGRFATSDVTIGKGGYALGA